MIHTQLKVVKNVFLATEGHLFYCEALSIAGIGNILDGISYEAGCEIYSGKIIKYTGPYNFKIRRIGVDYKKRSFVLIPGQYLGAGPMTMIDISIDDAVKK